MKGRAVGKRDFHAFLSHAHVDRVLADRLVSWLRDAAGVPVWYDAQHLAPGATIARQLPEAIEQSRALLLLLSRASVDRGWVEQEYDAAINHQATYRDFRIIPIRLDDVDPPGFLKNYSNIVLGPDGLDAAFACGLLKGLYQAAGPLNAASGRNTYFSRGWLPIDQPAATAVAAALARAGLQLIGDATDQQSWVEERIGGILDSCGAYAAVLPYRPTDQHGTSRYVLREWALAAARGLPCLVIADPRIPADALRQTTGLVAVDVLDDTDGAALGERALSLAESWTAPAASPSVFYATDFGSDGRELRRLVRELVEDVTTLPCVVGENVSDGGAVQQEILRRVCGATAVLADLTPDSPNVYIEVGAARATGVPLTLLRRAPQGRPAFMLRDREVLHYADEAELLGRVVRAVYPHRRALLTPAVF